MTPTLPPSTTAPPRDGARPPEPSPPTSGQMLEELIDLATGLGVMLLPLLVLFVPSIILFVLLPGILLLALTLPLAALGAVIAGPPYLLIRWLRRRRRTTAPPPAAPAGSAPSWRAMRSSA